MVACYLSGFAASLTAEFVAIESGKRDNRPELARTLARMSMRNATLVIGKLDRLARDAHFRLGLRRSGMAFTAADRHAECQSTDGLHHGHGG